MPTTYMLRRRFPTLILILSVTPLLVFGKSDVSFSQPYRRDPLPDLTILGFSIPTAKVSPGQSVTLKIRVRNAGLGAAPASKLSVAFSGTPYFQDAFAETILDVPPLPSQTSAKDNYSNTAWVTWSTFIPQTTSSYLYFLAKNDPYDEVAESSKNDNESGIKLAVVSPLEVADVIARKTPADVFHDLSVTFTNLSEIFDKLLLKISGLPGAASTTAATSTVSFPLQPIANLISVFTSTNNINPPTYGYRLEFRYDYFDETITSFHIYRKRPIDTSFVKYTYSVLTPASSSLPALPADIYTLINDTSYTWRWSVQLPTPVPTSALGEYQFYVTAVDSHNEESVSSTIQSFTVYAAPRIDSPANGSLVSSTPRISFVGDSHVSDQVYDVWLYGKSTPLFLPYRIGNRNNFIYDGPPLSPQENPYRIMVSSRIPDSQGYSLWAVSAFNVEN